MQPSPTFSVRDTDLLVVGAGLAGLTTALAAAADPARKITVLTKTDALGSGSSWWAQGGVAAVWGDDDSIATHVTDTIAASDGLSAPDIAELLATEGPAAVADLIERGMPFDRHAAGDIDLAREGGHSRRRILHADGDATGRSLIRFLLGLTGNAPSITVDRRAFVWDLIVRGGRVVGALVYHQDDDDGDRWVVHRAGDVVIASGGSGQLFGRTTNPAEATADGIALALRAGAVVKDLEFVQFHPTALDVDHARPGHRHGALAGRTPLLTEALRGEGAVLVDGEGKRIMTDLHPLGDLAPRDVVARAVAARLRRGEKVFLDTRAALGAAIAERFPTVHTQCLEAGVDPVRDPIAVAPAAHYHMGGIETDADGRTNVPGLWACGEAACTGLHGANRMAGNSLLECLTFGRRVVAAIDAGSAAATQQRRVPIDVEVPPIPKSATAQVISTLRLRLQSLMYDGVGVFRDGQGLTAALAGLDELAMRFYGLAAVDAAVPPGRPVSVRTFGELRNMLLAARMIAAAARDHRGSRGVHYREDYPERVAAWERRRSLAAGERDELAA